MHGIEIVLDRSVGVAGRFALLLLLVTKFSSTGDANLLVHDASAAKSIFFRNDKNCVEGKNGVNCWIPRILCVDTINDEMALT